MFSFQAIKHITTGDGGLVSLKNSELLEKAKRLRWFGIDRSQKQLGVWENDIKEVGYKYQMNDLSAALGLAALEEFDDVLTLRSFLRARYILNLAKNSNVTIVGEAVPSGDLHAAWLFTVLVDNREDLQKKLRLHNIESAQMHYRNDRYSIFGGRRDDLSGMDSIEDKYLVLPLHPNMLVGDVDRVCEVLNSGW
jgi:dTDP-4-amino-4,6-dideoxygalactose transaminase